MMPFFGVSRVLGQKEAGGASGGRDGLIEGVGSEIKAEARSGCGVESSSGFGSGSQAGSGSGLGCGFGSESGASTTNWDALRPAVCELARAAGAAIMTVYRSGEPGELRLADKADASPLTVADMAAHEVIVSGLRSLTPEWPVISEEGAAGDGQPAGGVYWLVDPLDGTKEFLAGSGEFTVNIGLVCKGEVVWGVVYAPALNVLYAGGKAWGATRQVADGAIEPIRVAALPTAGEPWKVVASLRHWDADTRAFVERLGLVELQRAGSSLKFCRVAEGTAHVYPRMGETCEWDTAAAQAVVEGAGGGVWALDGGRLQYGKAGGRNGGFVVACDQDVIG